MKWLEKIVGKTIVTVVSTAEDSDTEIEIRFASGEVLLLSSSGWSEGVTADGSEIVGEFNQATVASTFLEATCQRLANQPDDPNSIDV